MIDCDIIKGQKESVIELNAKQEESSKNEYMTNDQTSTNKENNEVNIANDADYFDEVQENEEYKENECPNISIDATQNKITTNELTDSSSPKISKYLI